MSAIVNPVIAGTCKNCGESTRYFYVAVKNGKYSHLFNCTLEKESA
jgi:RNase P subunit RPR2